jgi:hypothetical protein
VPGGWCLLGPVVAIALHAGAAQGASCCGGGGATSLILPKFATARVDGSVDHERYDGFWNGSGSYRSDPAGASLRQWRLNIGGAYRLADHWQGSLNLPLVRNDNSYPGVSADDSGIGDLTASLWYEAFEHAMCVYRVESLSDLQPTVYVGTSLTLPTGYSPYSDDVDSSFATTGKGFYRLDANLIVEKSVYPWTATLQGAYGRYLKRTINQEYGQPVQPYQRQPGDRTMASLAIGYTHFLDSLGAVTATLTATHLEEASTRIGSVRDGLSRWSKNTLGLSTSYTSPDLRWIYKVTWTHAMKRSGWGRNTSVTDVFSLGLSHVIF